MKNSSISIKMLHEALAKGLELSFKKLLRKKQAEDGVFIISENGKIQKVKARDITE